MTGPKQIIVIGAGVGGLGAALALSRAGHQVLVLERDATPVPERFEDAFAWERKGAPQFHHSHVFLPRLRRLLLDRFPDVRAALLDHGVPDGIAGQLFGLPPDLPGGEDLVLLPIRRTTYEWILRSVLRNEPGVEIRQGVNVAGLVCDPRAGRGAPPRVTGVTLADGEVLGAEMVVATTGRRGDLPGWLVAVGVAVDEQVVESGVSYLSRFFRRRPGTPQDDMLYTVARRAGVLFALINADNDTYSVTVLPNPDDHELRKHLLDAARFDAVCRLLPEFEQYLDAGLAEPITPVHAMAGLINRLRNFRGPNGEPLVEGFFPLGDAYMVTNPALARGCTVAMMQAVALADAIAEHPGDPHAQAASYLDVAAREVDPWFYISVLADQMNLAADNGSDFVIGVTGGGFSKLANDPASALAFARVFSMLDPPERLLADPAGGKLLPGPAFAGAKLPEDAAPLTRADLLRACVA